MARALISHPCPSLGGTNIISIRHLVLEARVGLVRAGGVHELHGAAAGVADEERDLAAPTFFGLSTRIDFFFLCHEK